MPAHRSSSRPRHRAGSPAKGLLASAALIGGSVTLALSTVGGSYALWSDTEELSPGTLTSGSLTLTVDAPASGLAGDWSNLLPGTSVTRQFTMSNTGTVPATVSASAVATGVDVQLRRGSCGGDVTGPSATATPIDLGVLAASATATVCLEATLNSSASQGKAYNFDLVLTANQQGQ